MSNLCINNNASTKTSVISMHSMSPKSCPHKTNSHRKTLFLNEKISENNVVLASKETRPRSKQKLEIYQKKKIAGVED